jgi:signal transduction histidine kinase
LRFVASNAWVALDADRFRRVVINLVENAAQAIEGGKVGVSDRRITVTTKASDCAEFVIADTGPGIPPEVLPKIFEPLFTTKSIGTGLGLPTVKQIVEQHGGEIHITSTPGKGTAVHIRLPLADPAMATA